MVFLFSAFDGPAIGLDQWWDRLDYLGQYWRASRRGLFPRRRRIFAHGIILAHGGSAQNLIIFRNTFFHVFIVFILFAWFSRCDFQVAKGRDEHPGGVLTDFFREGKNSVHGIILAHVFSSACRRNVDIVPELRNTRSSPKTVPKSAERK